MAHPEVLIPFKAGQWFKLARLAQRELHTTCLNPF